MNVLFVSAEAAPFAKVGGLGDVLGSLPQALRESDVDARVVMPGYAFIPHFDYDIKLLFTFQLPRPTGTTDVKVFTTVYDGVPFYFLQGWPFFGEEESAYSEWDWDRARFIFFCQAAIAFMEEQKQRLDWFPDVVHVNDWHTGLVPFLMVEKRDDPMWENTASLLSIHNIAYQGDYVGGWLWELGIPGRDHPDLVYQDLTDNLMAMAIAYSDIITTVSPRYSIEIQYPPMDYGLAGMIRVRSTDVYGVLNGINVERFDPETDTALAATFNAANFREKRPANKRKLQELAGLEVNDDIPLIGIVSRLVWQKGMDIAIPALRDLLVSTNVQLVALGTGDPQIGADLAKLASDFSWKATCILKYDEEIAQNIYGGCDIFLMPSHYEPCGVGQMIAMRYGALPLVRETGGLADTVQNYDNASAEWGTGFMFLFEEADALVNTLNWAVDTYRYRKEAWHRMQERAMQQDFSWKKSAAQYIDLYHKAIEQRKE